jgi:hypothetical protein
VTNPASAIHRVMQAEPFRVLLIKEQISAVCTQANILYATFSLVVVVASGSSPKPVWL